MEGYESLAVDSTIIRSLDTVASMLLRSQLSARKKKTFEVKAMNVLITRWILGYFKLSVLRMILWSTVEILIDPPHKGGYIHANEGVPILTVKYCRRVDPEAVASTKMLVNVVTNYGTFKASKSSEVRD